MKRILLALWLLARAAYAGDTYDCINSKTDYINYGPPAPPRNACIVGAPDSRRYDRWLPMLSQEDERRLLFIQAQRLRETFIIYANP